MKKLSFFLMAMLFSVMSFAQTVLFTQTYPGSPSAYTSAYTKSFNLTTDGYKLTYTNINNGQQKDGWTAIRSGSKNGASVATILSEQIAKPVVWQMVMVAFFCISIIAAGLPTTRERPMTTAFLPLQSMP